MTMLAEHHPEHRRLRPLGADLVFRSPHLTHTPGERTHPRLRPGRRADAVRRRTRRRVARGLQGHRQAVQRALQAAAAFRPRRLRVRGPGYRRTHHPAVRSVPRKIYPLVGNVPSLARLLWLRPTSRSRRSSRGSVRWGMVPLPSKRTLQFGEPIRTDSYDAS